MHIPYWARKYFSVEGDIFRARLSISQRDYFADMKKNYKTEYLSIQDWSDLSEDEIKYCARNYILCNFALGVIDQEKGAINKANGDFRANDGLNRQHWIPECYMKPFAKDNEVRKIEKGLLTKLNQTSIENWPKKIGRMTGLNSSEFRETTKAKGKLYSPDYELILSKLEGDYAELEKSSAPIKNLWDFIVISIFFVVFSLRTKERFDNHSADWTSQKGLLLDIIPGLVSRFDVMTYEWKDVFPDADREKGTFGFPFNQHPLFEERESQEDFSYWAIYTPNCLLWLRSKHSMNGPVPEDQSFLQHKLLAILKGNDNKTWYFHPDHDFFDISISPEPLK